MNRNPIIFGSLPHCLNNFSLVSVKYAEYLLILTNMGGGVSLIENMQEVMVSTILIGRAISAVSFPGMYRIYDFHSARF